MNKRLLFGFLSTLAFIVLFASNTPAQDFLFTSINNNLEDIEKQGVFTGASLAADFDGEGVNNDAALIDQKRGIVFVLIYNQKTATARFVIPIDVRGLAGEQLLPTSATAFIDPQTGLQNIAIAAAQPNNDGVGKLIIGINEGSSLFNDVNLFSVFDAASSPTDINHGDFNNDGADDLVYIDFRNDNAVVLLNDGSNRFLQPNAAGSGGFEPVSAVVSDFNDDDYLDLAVLNRDNAADVPFSPIRLLFGDGSGRLTLSSEIYQAPFNAISLAGGLMDYGAQTFGPDGKLARRMMDLNRDGYPDLAALSPNADKVGSPSITILINRFDSPGKFNVNLPVILSDFDDKGSALAVAADKGGAAMVSGKGSGSVGVGGAYHALGVADFNADGSPDFVVSSAILPPAGTPGANTNFRGAAYLFGNYTASTARISRPLSFGYIKNAPSTKDFSQLDPADGNDTFVAAIPGAFGVAENAVPGVLHVSFNGNLWLDANRTSILGRVPFAEIKRSDLNAPLGSGRKYVITAGETAAIPISAVFSQGELVRLFLNPTPSGEQPPSFVVINQKDKLPVVGEAIVNSADVNRGPGDKLFRIAVEAIGDCSSPCGRLPLTDVAFFTLVVKPNSPPAIAPIPNQTVAIGITAAIRLNISDPENQRVTASVACDRGDFARIDPATNTLLLTPESADIGTAACTVKATDQFGLFGQTSFAVTAVSGITIVSADFAKKSLVINGAGFGASGAKTIINGSDVSASISSQSNTQVVLKGNKKKLKLKKGSNRITISVNGSVSNTFVLRL